MSNRVNRAVQRGQLLFSELPHARQRVSDALHGGSRLVDRVLAPAGGAVADAAVSAGRALKPRHLGYAAAAIAGAPILMRAFDAQRNKREDELMRAYHTPDQVVTASLDEFLEKKAARPSPPPFSYENTLKERGFESFSSGVGSEVARAALNAVFGGAATLYDSAKNKLVSEPNRKRLVESLIRIDPVISDFVNRTPEGASVIAEAYGTMVRFAPSLSEDPNAVRSFLREAVLGGAGVNYATIKNLIETEKAHKYGPSPR